MTHYANSPGSVRFDFYRPSGKWYMTEALDMDSRYNDTDIYEAVRATAEAWRPGVTDHYIIVVAEPYHRNAYPIMLLPRKVHE